MGNDVPRVALKQDDSTGRIGKEPLQRFELQGEVNMSVHGGGGDTARQELGAARRQSGPEEVCCYVYAMRPCAVSG